MRRSLTERSGVVVRRVVGWTGRTRRARCAGGQRRPHPLGGRAVTLGRGDDGGRIGGPFSRSLTDDFDEGDGEIAQTHIEMLTRARQGGERRTGVRAGHRHHESLRLLDHPPVLDHLDHLLGSLLLAGAVLDHGDGTGEQRLQAVKTAHVVVLRRAVQIEGDHEAAFGVLLVGGDDHDPARPPRADRGR